MPEISRFFGIIIRMYPNDHGAPHVHAYYAEFEAAVGTDGAVLRGELPARVQGLVTEWVVLHHEEVLTNWFLLREGSAPSKIAPLT